MLTYLYLASIDNHCTSLSHQHHDWPCCCSGSHGSCCVTSNAMVVLVVWLSVATLNTKAKAILVTSPPFLCLDYIRVYHPHNNHPTLLLPLPGSATAVFALFTLLTLMPWIAPPTLFGRLSTTVLVPLLYCVSSAVPFLCCPTIVDLVQSPRLHCSADLYLRLCRHDSTITVLPPLLSAPLSVQCHSSVASICRCTTMFLHRFYHYVILVLSPWLCRPALLPYLCGSAFVSLSHFYHPSLHYLVNLWFCWHGYTVIDVYTTIGLLSQCIHCHSFLNMALFSTVSILQAPAQQLQCLWHSASGALSL